MSFWTLISDVVCEPDLGPQGYVLLRKCPWYPWGGPQRRESAEAEAKVCFTSCLHILALHVFIDSPLELAPFPLPLRWLYLPTAVVQWSFFVTLTNYCRCWKVFPLTPPCELTLFCLPLCWLSAVVSWSCFLAKYYGCDVERPSFIGKWKIIKIILKKQITNKVRPKKQTINKTKNKQNTINMHGLKLRETLCFSLIAAACWYRLLSKSTVCCVACCQAATKLSKSNKGCLVKASNNAPITLDEDKQPAPVARGTHFCVFLFCFLFFPREKNKKTIKKKKVPQKKGYHEPPGHPLGTGFLFFELFAGFQ